jgi:hypothetical protein
MSAVIPTIHAGSGVEIVNAKALLDGGLDPFLAA